MKTLVIAELHESKPRTATFSSITFAKEFSQGEFDILCIGEGATSAASALQSYGAGKVIVAEIDGGYVAEAYAPTVTAVAEEYACIVATATAYGKDLITLVAAKLEAGVAQDISAFEGSAAETVYTRPMYAGNMFGKLKIKTDRHAVTVRQSAFDPATPSGGESSLETTEVADNPLADKIEFLGLEVVESERPDLAEADVVVSGGRALKSAENFEKVLEPLVDQLGAAMGASRAACDAGYVPNELQVGQTGKMVAPKLYIAVGISGAIQHLAGMKGSKTIVAINTDNEAPIGQIADYFWTEDLFTAVPALTEALKNQ